MLSGDELEDLADLALSKLINEAAALNKKKKREMKKSRRLMMFGTIWGRRKRPNQKNSNHEEARRRIEARPRFRNWADDLPWPALSLILQKLGGIDVLVRAQWVCRSWWKASLDPCSWRITDMMNHADLFNVLDMEAMAMVAVDRSKGLMEEFYAEYFGSDKLLRYIADRTKILKRLRLISAYEVSDEGLAETISQFPLLEELDLTHCSFSEEVCKLVGQACPHLKCFRLNTRNSKLLHEERDEEDVEDVELFGSADEQAFGIANNMPELRQLQLVGNGLTNEGLKAILDKCKHLEALDIRRCFSVKLDASLGGKCAKMKDLKLPDDSTKGYGWVFDDEYRSFDGYQSSPSLWDYSFGWGY